MAVTNTPTTLASRLKQRFNKEVTTIIPAVSDLQRRLKFKKDMELGSSAEFDVTLAPEQGFSSGTGSVTLNGAVAQVAARATVGAFSLILQSRVSYDLITRSSTNEKAFAKFADGKFLNMVEAFRNREEWIALNGRRSVGTVVSNTAGVIVITPATWCPAMAASMIGATLTAFTALVAGTQHNADVVVSAVNLVNRSYTVTGTNAAIVANDFLFLKGHHDDGRFGLMDIAYNTGTIFGISAATNPLWAANTFDVGTSAITIGKILSGAALAAQKGCVGEKLVCYVPVQSFQGLVADESSLIRYAAGKSKAESGFEVITVLGATGMIEIVPHIYMKDGEAVLFCPDYTYIIGSAEADTRIAKDGDIMFDLESTSDKEMRMFSDTCGVFSERPGYVVLFTRSDALALHV